MPEISLNVLMFGCAILAGIAALGSAYIGYKKAILLEREKAKAEMQRQRDQGEITKRQSRIDDLLRSNKQLMDINHQEDMQKQELIALLHAQQAEDNRRWTEERMTEAKSRPYLMFGENADREKVLYWQNPGEDPATVFHGYYLVRSDEPDGSQQSKWNELKSIIVPPNIDGSVDGPRVTLDLPDKDEIHISIKGYARKGAFAQELYLQRVDTSYAQAYNIADLADLNAPVRYYMDNHFNLSRVKTYQFLTLTKTWPKRKGDFVRNDYVTSSEANQQR